MDGLVAIAVVAPTVGFAVVQEDHAAKHAVLGFTTSISGNVHF